MPKRGGVPDGVPPVIVTTSGSGSPSLVNPAIQLSSPQFSQIQNAMNAFLPPNSSWFAVTSPGTYLGSNAGNSVNVQVVTTLPAQLAQNTIYVVAPAYQNANTIQSVTIQTQAQATANVYNNMVPGALSSGGRPPPPPPVPPGLTPPNITIQNGQVTVTPAQGGNGPRPGSGGRPPINYNAGYLGIQNAFGGPEATYFADQIGQALAAEGLSEISQFFALNAQLSSPYTNPGGLFGQSQTAQAGAHAQAVGYPQGIQGTIQYLQDQVTLQQLDAQNQLALDTALGITTIETLDAQTAHLYPPTTLPALQLGPSLIPPNPAPPPSVISEVSMGIPP